MRLRALIAAGAGVALLAPTPLGASTLLQAGSFDFEPITASATPTETPDASAPWLLPDGFSQELVSGEDESACAGLNIYGEGLNDWHDMNTVNETGKDKGRYVYRTHEVRLGGADAGQPEPYPEGGAVSVVDLETCEAAVIAQDPTWTALDGIVWTPWGTVLFAEETEGGRLFELVPDNTNPMVGDVFERPAVGLLAHEGIEIGPDGEIYVVDEYRGQTEGEGGGIYKFVPDTYGDLSSGELFVLGVNGETTTGEGVGEGEWIGPIDAATARAAGTAAGGTSYQRPEDLERIGYYLYAAVTEGTRDAADEETYEGRVIVINLKTLCVDDFIKPGVNAPVEIGVMGEAGAETGFDGPDNLASGPGGVLWIIEDNTASDIWVADGRGGHAKGVKHFASLTDGEAEGTGIYFLDADTLLVNIQHSVYPDGDGTWTITKDS